METFDLKGPEGEENVDNKEKKQSKLSKVGKMAIVGLAGVLIGQSDVIDEHKEEPKHEVKTKQTEHHNYDPNSTNDPIAKDPEQIEKDHLNNSSMRL